MYTLYFIFGYFSVQENAILTKMTFLIKGKATSKEEYFDNKYVQETQVEVKNDNWKWKVIKRFKL